MAGDCVECKKTFLDPKILGTRRYCPNCGAYLGTTKKAQVPYLPGTWWRTRTGVPKTLKTIQDERPKP